MKPLPLSHQGWWPPHIHHLCGQKKFRTQPIPSTRRQTTSPSAPFQSISGLAWPAISSALSPLTNPDFHVLEKVIYFRKFSEGCRTNPQLGHPFLEKPPLSRPYRSPAPNFNPPPTFAEKISKFFATHLYFAPCISFLSFFPSRKKKPICNLPRFPPSFFPDEGRSCNFPPTLTVFPFAWPT